MAYELRPDPGWGPRLLLALAGLVAATSCTGGGSGTLPDGSGNLDGEVDAPFVADGPVQEGPRRDGAVDAPPACGRAGEICCANNGCDSGGCCVGGSCVARGLVCRALGGICSNGSCGNCGALDQPCCDGNVCTGFGATCRQGMCRCGEAGEACCPPSAPVADGGSAPGDAGAPRPASGCVRDNLTCTPARLCQPCGEPGQPCCGTQCGGGGCCWTGACVAPGGACAPSAGTCEAGRCSGCGAKGQVCCGNVCHEDRTRCSGPVAGNTCVSCGGDKEPCCSVAPACGARLMCEIGRCARCGGPGEPCCPGDKCEGGCCVTGRCIGNGMTCANSSGQYGPCVDGRCDCGGLGKPCCPGGGPAVWCVQPGTTCIFQAGARTCMACGAPGGPCCGSGNKCEGSGCCYQGRCFAEGAKCASGTSPAAGICKARVCECGKLGLPCCDGVDCMDAGSGCAQATRTCVKCGDPGGPCCANFGCTGGCCGTPNDATGTCVSAGAACANPGGVCAASGSCGACGGIAQPCCMAGGRSFCSATGSMCVGRTCVACGDKGQVCCDYLHCRDGLRCNADDVCVDAPAGTPDGGSPG